MTEAAMNGNGQHRPLVQPVVTLGNLLSIAAMVVTILGATIAITRAIGQIEIGVAVLDNRVKAVEKKVDRLEWNGMRRPQDWPQ